MSKELGPEMMTDASSSPGEYLCVELGPEVGVLTSQESQLRETVFGTRALK